MPGAGLIFAASDPFGMLIFFIIIVVVIVSNVVKANNRRSDTQRGGGGVPRPRWPVNRRNASPTRQYPRANGMDVVMGLQRQKDPVAEVVAVDDGEDFDSIEGESHVTPMGEPYHSSLVTETAPSVEHSAEHIGTEMPEGTVAPPPPGATVKAGATVAIRRARVGNAALPKLKLKRGRTALRSALVLREVLSRPRAYDI